MVDHPTPLTFLAAYPSGTPGHAIVFHAVVIHAVVLPTAVAHEVVLPAVVP